VDIADFISAGVVVESERDRRTLLFLVETCGRQEVIQAAGKLPGRTRPWVSNLAKILSVVVPEAVVITPRAVGREHLQSIKEILSKSRK